MSKLILVIAIFGVCLVGSVIFLKQTVVSPSAQVGVTISENAAIELVRRLPEVHDFATKVETAFGGERRVSYRVERDSNNKMLKVSVFESSSEKDTVWQRFYVSDDSKTILVENNLTGEIEPYFDN